MIDRIVCPFILFILSILLEFLYDQVAGNYRR